MIEEPRRCECCGSTEFVMELWEEAVAVKLCSVCRFAYQAWRLDPSTAARGPSVARQPDVLVFANQRTAWLEMKKTQPAAEQLTEPIHGAHVIRPSAETHSAAEGRVGR